MPTKKTTGPASTTDPRDLKLPHRHGPRRPSDALTGTRRPAPAASPAARDHPRRGAAAGPPPDPKVERVAVELMNAFRHERWAHEAALLPPARLPQMPNWDHQLPPAMADHWRAAAKRLAADGVDAVTFMARLFRKADPLGSPVAQYVTSAKAWAAYRGGREADLEEARVRSTSGQACYERHLSTLGASQHVTTPEDTRLEAIDACVEHGHHLLAYCVATKLAARGRADEQAQLLRTAAELRADAMLEYLRNPEGYDAWWSKLLPEGFRAMAFARFRAARGASRHR